MLALKPPVAPMLARLARELPVGDEWVYEPKWDGFRCVLFADGDDIVLQSRNLRPLGRYFPEVVAAARALRRPAVVDGEIVVSGFGFATLLERIHPSASRVATLAERHPATFAAFDCLAVAETDLTSHGLTARRAALEHLGALTLTPASPDPDRAREWFDRPRPGWDGVVAKRVDAPYSPGQRTMVKVKRERTADCVVAGVRVSTAGAVSSLLLGLWTPDGALHHPGVVSSPPRAVKAQLAADLARLLVPIDVHPWRAGFGLEGGATGRLKGAGSRWLPGMTQDWLPIAPVQVAEVGYDRVDGLRFRHPAKFRHWRPDRDPRSCVVAQLVTD